MLDQKYFEEMEAKIPKGKVRTRFAPSPTGYMHVGNLRTALYTWLIARNAGGTFILRIEDTDQGRLVEGATDVIYRTLAECGLDHDEGPDVGGPVAPYIQSQRRDTYGKYARLLVEKGHAYYCFCEKSESEEDSGDFARAADPCRDLPLDEALARVEAGEPYVIRQKIPQEGSTTFHDAIFGDITVENKTLDDQVLLKRDGLPTYNFANVIDDHLMGITHVVRGSEYLSSAPKYDLLYRAFGWDVPVYVHCSPVMRDAQNKMSKRHGDPSYEDLRAQGFLTEAILNYVALLGWSPRGDIAEQEVFSLQELAKAFDLAGMSKSPAIFDIEKLTHFNAIYLRAMAPEAFADVARPYIRQAVQREDISADDIAALLQARGEKLTDMGYGTGLHPNAPYVAVKVPVFSFEKLHGVDTQFGPEMKSTGEVLGIAPNYHDALLKGLIGAGYTFKTPGPASCCIFTVKDSDKPEFVDIAWKLKSMGYKLYGTSGTCAWLNKHMVPCNEVRNMSGEAPNIVDLLQSGLVDYVFSTSAKGRDPKRDSVRLRRKAVELSIPCITAVDTANALVECLRSEHELKNIPLVDIATLYHKK